MESFSKLYLLVAAEVLFALLVGAGMWVAVLQRSLRSAQRQDEKKSIMIERLRAQMNLLRENMHMHQKAKEKAWEKQDRRKADIEGLAAKYQKRITHLEKFRTLYLELEAKLSASVTPGGAGETVFNSVVDTQNRLINDLKEKLAFISGKYEAESDLGVELRDTIILLEDNVSMLSGRLEKASRNEAIAEIEAAELEQYKDRVRRLEKGEKQLKSELAEHRQRAIAKTSASAKSQEAGQARLREIVELSGKLRQREDEVVRLQKECEVIGQQYEELAMKSMADNGQTAPLSESDRRQMERLQKMLRDANEALELKQAECAMLENYYLKMEEAAEEEVVTVGDATDPVAESSLDDASGQVNDVEDGIQSLDPDELAALRETLANTESDLEAMKESYQQIKEQFVEVAQEEMELKKNYKDLKAECQSLRDQLKEAQQLAAAKESHQSEFLELQQEYQKLEFRYQALIDKHSLSP